MVITRKKKSERGLEIWAEQCYNIHCLKFLRDCVRVAQVTLDHSVWVQILVPQPNNHAPTFKVGHDYCSDIFEKKAKRNTYRASETETLQNLAIIPLLLIRVNKKESRL